MTGEVEVTEQTRERQHASTLRNRLAGRGASLVVGLVFFLYAARLFRLISRYAVNIFFSDQWDFNQAILFQKHSLWEMFDLQHGPHRQGLGALLSKLVNPPFHWNSRTESFMVGGVIVAAAICALSLKKRLYGPLALSDVAIPAILFIPAQWEALFVAANFAHGPLPLLLIALYCLAWTCGRRVVRYPLVLLINFVTIYTGFGLFLGVLTPILLVLDYQASIPEKRLPRIYFVSTLVVSLASLGSFFIGYKFQAAIDCFTLQPRSPGSYVTFMAIMFANFLAVKGVGALPWIVGVTILIAMLASLAIAVWQLLRQTLNPRNPNQNRPLITAALIAYCLLFCMSTAYGRLCAGLWTAHSPRYVIYVEIGMLGLYFHLLSLRRALTRRLLLAGLVASILPASLHVDQGDMAYFRDIRQRWKACYLQTEDIKNCDRVAGFPIFPYAERTHLQEKLEYLKRTRQNLYLDSK
jgi:hypothetical protein